MDILTALFSSKAKSELITKLFSDELPEFYIRELERQTGIDYKALHTELNKLLQVDLLQSRKDGNRTYFKAKKGHPLCPLLIELVKKTAGIESGLRALIVDHQDIEFAFIFGSYAKGDFNSQSDIDLFCVGTISSPTLSELLYDLQTKSGREINFHLYDKKELKKALDEKRHFVTSLKTTPKIFVKGEESDFKRILKRKGD